MNKGNRPLLQWRIGFCFLPEGLITGDIPSNSQGNENPAWVTWPCPATTALITRLSTSQSVLAPEFFLQIIQIYVLARETSQQLHLSSTVVMMETRLTCMKSVLTAGADNRCQWRIQEKGSGGLSPPFDKTNNEGTPPQSLYIYIINFTCICFL